MSEIFFPLRTNANALIVGRGINEVRSRLKLAGLLHDKVYVEEGMMDIHAGPSLSFSISMPSDWREMVWQTPRDRGRSTGFSVSLQPSNDASASPLVQSSPTSIYWRPTFEPFKREMPSVFPWMQFTGVKFSAAGEAAMPRVAASMGAVLPDQPKIVRDVVVKAVAHDVVAGADGTGLSFDRFHTALVEDLVRKGMATPVAGAGALTVIFPAAGSLSWDDVNDLRSIASVKSFRRILSEIEHDAMHSTTTVERLKFEIMQEYSERLHKAQLSLPWNRAGLRTGIRLAVGSLASAGAATLGGQLAGQGAKAVAALGAGVAATRLLRPRWLTFNAALSRRIERREL